MRVSVEEWLQIEAHVAYEEAARLLAVADYQAEEADARAREAEDWEEPLAFLVHEHRKKLSAQRAFTAGAVLAAAIVAIALLFAALPAHAEPATLTAARTAQVSCVQREYRTRTASAGVSATEAALVARAQAEHACALEAWSRALGAAAEVRVVTATRAPVVCEANTPAPLESCPGDRPTWIDLLSHGGACALCGGGVALGAWAACGGAR